MEFDEGEFEYETEESGGFVQTKEELSNDGWLKLKCSKAFLNGNNQLADVRLKDLGQAFLGVIGEQLKRENRDHLLDSSNIIEVAESYTFTQGDRGQNNQNVAIKVKLHPDVSFDSQCKLWGEKRLKVQNSLTQMDEFVDVLDVDVGSRATLFVRGPFHLTPEGACDLFDDLMLENKARNAKIGTPKVLYVLQQYIGEGAVKRPNMIMVVQPPANSTDVCNQFIVKPSAKMITKFAGRSLKEETHVVTFDSPDWYCALCGGCGHKDGHCVKNKGNPAFSTHATMACPSGCGAKLRNGEAVAKHRDSDLCKKRTQVRAAMTDGSFFKGATPQTEGFGSTLKNTKRPRTEAGTPGSAKRPHQNSRREDLSPFQEYWRSGGAPPPPNFGGGVQQHTDPIDAPQNQDAMDTDFDNLMGYTNETSIGREGEYGGTPSRLEEGGNQYGSNSASLNAEEEVISTQYQSKPRGSKKGGKGV